MHRKSLVTIALIAVVATVSACSTKSSTNSTTATADTAAAQAAIAPYLNSPSPFTVSEPLLKKPNGKKIAILDCGSPICGLFADLAVAPAKALGMTATRISAGTTADGVAAAFNTVLSGGFDGVFVPAIAPSLWERPLAQLNAARIPVVTSGIIGLDPSKVGAAGAAGATSDLSGKLMADWVVTREGNKTNVVFYTTPELSFSAVIGDAFRKEMDKVCKGCVVRTVDIPVAKFGTGAPQIVVDDLQAHPDTKTAAFAVGEQAIGLAPALKTADIKVSSILNSPDPSILASIKDGTYTAGMGVDLAVLTWTSIDSLARLTTSEPVSEGAKKDQIVRQILTASNLKGDVSQGWTGYPDFAGRFAKLWANAK